MTTWHAPPDVLARFATDPSTLDDAVASSLEAHLLACAPCRQAVAATATRADPVLGVRSWERVADRIDRPARSPLERLLGTLGVQDGAARLLASTPGLRLAWLGALAAVTAAAVAAARSNDSLGPFLAIAPLAPLAAVAATFAATADPAGEAGVATPLHGAGLVLRRAASVLASTLLILGVGSLALPGVGLDAAAWVLPGTALAVGALAMGTRWPVAVATAALTAAWVLAVPTALWWAGKGTPLSATVIFRAPGQLTAFALALTAASVVAARRDAYSTLEVRR